MSPRGRPTGPSAPVIRGSGGTSGNPTATAKSRQTSTTESAAAAPRRGGPRRAKPTPSPKRTDATGVSASGSVQRRRSDSAIPSGHARSQASSGKPATRNRFREESSHLSAHPRTSSQNRTRRADSSWSEYGELPDAPRRGELTDAVVELLKTYVQHLLDAVRDRGELLTRKIQEWMDTLVEAIAHGGAGMRAGLAGIQAAAMGKNPALAAIRGLVSGLSGQAKVALVLLLVVGLLLGPVLLVVLLLVLVVVALFAAVRAATE
jgi:hypothetical protein